MKSTRLFIFTSLTFFLTSLTLLFATAAQAQVPSYVPTNGLVGYWPFNGNANDESGNGNNGTVNGATLATDRFGNVDKSFLFNGSNNFITIPTSPELEIIGDLTISIWKQSFGNTGSYETFLTKSDANSNWNYSIAASQYYGPGGCSGELDKYMTGRRSFNGGQYELRFSDSTVSVSNGFWVNVTLVIQNNVVTFYIDGVDGGTTCFGNTFSIPSVDVGAQITIGSCNCALSQYMNGKLDDIGIWNRALTADEVLALYNGCNLTPQVVTGNPTPGAFSNATYTCNNNAGSTYSWTVNNGVIVSGQGTNSVTILWGAEGAGSVSVTETTADGCVGDAVVYDVNVQCVVSGNAITGPVGPEAFSNSTYTCNGAGNSTYNWTVTNGVIASGQGTNTVNILWASTGLGNVSVVETTAEGCVGTTLSQDVVVIPTNVEELSKAMILYPNPVTTELNLQTTTDLFGTDLFVFDALGKQILKQQILSTNTTINTSSFAVGNYVVKVGGGVKKFEVVR